MTFAIILQSVCYQTITYGLSFFKEILWKQDYLKYCYSVTPHRTVTSEWMNSLFGKYSEPVSRKCCYSAAQLWVVWRQILWRRVGRKYANTYNLQAI